MSVRHNLYTGSIHVLFVVWVALFQPLHNLQSKQEMEGGGRGRLKKLGFDAVEETCDTVLCEDDPDPACDCVGHWFHTEWSRQP